MAKKLMMTVCLTLALTGGSISDSSAQMVTGDDMPGYDAVFGLTAAQQAKNYSVIQLGSSAGANVLWPGETASFSFRLTNKTPQSMQITGRVEVIQYRTRVNTGDIWVPHVLKIADIGSVPVKVNLPANSSANITVKPIIPAKFGGYALIFDLGSNGRAFGAAIARTLPADPGKVRLPTFALDMPRRSKMSDKVALTFQKLGTKASRMEVSYTPTTSPNFDRDLAKLTQHLKWAQDNNISVMLTVGAGSAPQPLDRGRPWLNDDNSMKENVKEDLAWLPSYDEDFQKWIKLVASRFGWPKGPVNAIELWNEPWEGVSISGWGADLPRYREIYEHMAKGIMEARQDAGVQVLIGGASSSSNTLDKLFPDGSDKFLPMLDFVSIHYQEMAATPSLVPEWMNRKSPYGRVQVWDTESWVANSEDRIAAVIASMRAQGQDRTVGIYGRNVYEPKNYDIDGRQYSVVQAWAPAAAVAATQKFIGQRAFKELLFKNGLPWVFVFDGLAGNPDDGTVVIVGDLGGVYNRNKLLFRSVLGLKNVVPVTQAKQKLAALPADAPKARRKLLEEQVKAAQVLDGASLNLSDGKGEFILYDFYGNPVRARNGKIVVPLNGLGYFLRTNGSKGAFGKLLNALRTSRIDGYQPLNLIAHDMTAPIESKPSLRLTLTNILNRPVSGILTTTLGHLKIEPAVQKLRFAPHETKEVVLKIADGAPTPDNTYPLSVSFDAGKDGTVQHTEAMHVNVIAKRTIAVDGNLDDWKGILPQIMRGAGMGASLTEKAYLPFVNFDTNVGSGFATSYLAYDDKYLYFAAKIADNTPYDGNVRFETRDDDSYYYPEKVTDKGRELTWPAGVRRFSYRKDPDLPSGNGTDNVQLAFNVIPEDKKPWFPNPPGTMPRFMAYQDTDYEYAFNQVAPKYGGGTEIWRLLAPGVPRKHFYPRQPKAPIDGGSVKNGLLTMTRQRNTRIVETALPWSEITEIKKHLDAGQQIKFSFRVNDNDGPAYELAAGRSVSKDNSLAFHNDWTTHWANELEFGFQN